MQKTVQRRLVKVVAALAARDERQAELEFAEEEVLRADRAREEASAAVEAVGGGEAEVAAKRAAEAARRSREADSERADIARERAQQKVDAAREAVKKEIEEVVESATKFVDSFVKTTARPVRADQVKTAQSEAKGVFKQLLPAWTNAKKMRESSAKAFALRRRLALKAVEQAGVVAAAERHAHKQDGEHAAAAEEEEAFRDQRAAKEARLAELEASRDEAEADEANARQRRDGLKKELPVAKELVAAARAAEKDAVAERHDLHNKCSKVERAQHEMEEAKNSAIRALHAEEYNATQVEQAYSQKRKSGD